MWYDATSAVSVLEDPESYQDLVGKIGYAPAPIAEKPNSGWLYTWSLGIPKSSQESGRRVEVHLLDDQQGLPEDGRREAGLGARPTGQPAVDLPDSGIRGRSRSPTGR